MDTSTEQLATLVARKANLLTLLKQFTEKQLGVIAGEDTALLLKLLAGKQSLVDQLQAVERELAPFREQDPETRVWRSAEHRRACQHLAAACETLIHEILELDRRGEGELIRRRDAAAEQLQGLQTTAHAHRAYLQVPQAVAGGFDLVSER
jgi:flagellar biosynthesis/type III secretory pathway chaperone